MYQLTISKRFEFSASHRLENKQWSADKNISIFGDSYRGPFGHGHNFVAFFSFSGPVDPNTGMIVELSQIKSQVNSRILVHYDHFFLNELPQFQSTIPTPELIAYSLLSDARQLFRHETYHPTSVYLQETPYSSASAHQNGTVLRSYCAGNQAFTLKGPIDPEIGSIIPPALIENGLPKSQVNDLISHRRTKTNDAWIVSKPDDTSYVEIVATFTATHRLAWPHHTDDLNRLCFGRCFRPHGHMFDVWATFQGTELNIELLTLHVNQILADWQYTALDHLPEFHGSLTSIEQIIYVLWTKLDRIDLPLVKLTIHETANNRFTLRRTP